MYPTLSDDFFGGTLVAAGADLPSTPSRTCGDDFCELATGDCTDPFRRVGVSFYRLRGNRVFWEYDSDFKPNGVVTATLQRTVPGGDFVDVAGPSNNTYELVDQNPERTGSRLQHIYRVKIEYDGTVDYSETTGVEGVLGRKDFLIFREVRRQVAKQVVSGWSPGAVIRRRESGDPCGVCLDQQTGRPTREDCPSCYGTGYECGWLEPTACTWALLNAREFKVKSQSKIGRDTQAGMPAIFLDPHTISDGDIWVDLRTDERYRIDDLKEDMTWRGIPITSVSRLHLLSDNNAAYGLPQIDLLEAVR